MKWLFFCFLFLTGVFCSASNLDLPDHTTVAQIAYIRFTQDTIKHDFGQAVDVLCVANHVKNHKEHKLGDLMFSCFSSLEGSGVFIEVDSITCAEDVSNSDLVHFTNPIRLSGCFLTPVVKALPDDYEQRLADYKRASEWVCAEADCSSVKLTLYQMVRHQFEYMLTLPTTYHLKCGAQVCYVEKTSSFDFYKKLFLLFWNK
jgi:hypothetical protein